MWVRLTPPFSSTRAQPGRNFGNGLPVLKPRDIQQTGISKVLVMRRTLVFALVGTLASCLAAAALPEGAKAPDFTTQASLGGKPFQFALADALKKGPVVLYFYPAAFTPGCTKEAHDFAEATDKFKSMGATVIGVSYDNIDTLNKFSVSECRNKFAVASDSDQKIMKAYDAVLTGKPEWANRTSYVISPAGEILYSYTDLKPDKHVENTMAAVQKWADSHQKGHKPS
jgi:thioredoxin-dependent peroxiredoxin